MHFTRLSWPAVQVLIGDRAVHLDLVVVLDGHGPLEDLVRVHHVHAVPDERDQQPRLGRRDAEALAGDAVLLHQIRERAGHAAVPIEAAAGLRHLLLIERQPEVRMVLTHVLDVPLTDEADGLAVRRHEDLGGRHGNTQQIADAEAAAHEDRAHVVALHLILEGRDPGPLAPLLVPHSLDRRRHASSPSGRGRGPPLCCAGYQDGSHGPSRDQSRCAGWPLSLAKHNSPQ